MFKQCLEVANLLSGFKKPWFFGGGWAIDLFLGKETRVHQDVEIVMFREDQSYLKEYLNGWEFRKVIAGEMSPWESEYLELPVHEVHAFDPVTGMKLEVLFNEAKENHWIFRKNPSITYRKDSIWKYTDASLPFLIPEIVLLYKASHTREKDHKDFNHLKDELSAEQKNWLKNAVQDMNPNHEWIRSLV